MSRSDPEPSLVAGVLAGGRSERMGSSKAALPLPGGPTMIERVVDVARAVPGVEELFILGAAPGLPASLAAIPVLRDTVPDAGPLAGLASLLGRASGRWALLLACDLPLLDCRTLGRLIAEIDEAVDVVAYQRTEEPRTWHTCTALVHPRLGPSVASALAEGRRSLQSLFDVARLRSLVPTEEEARRLLNVNDPADLERARRALRE